MELSICASALSPSSRGRMFGSGYASMASACLDVITLCSHALLEWNPCCAAMAVSFLASSVFRSFHQLSDAMIRSLVLLVPPL